MKFLVALYLCILTITEFHCSIHSLFLSAEIIILTSSTSEPQNITTTSSQAPSTTSEIHSSSRIPTTAIVTTTPVIVSSTALPDASEIKITYENGTKTCLKLNAAFRFEIAYLKKDRSNGTAIINMPSTAVPDRNDTICSKEAVNLFLTFQMGSENWTLSLDWTKKKDNYYVSGIYLAYIEDPNLFTDTLNPYAERSIGTDSLSKKLFETDTSSSYKCKSSQTYTIVTDEFTLDTSDIQVQAFSFDKNDKFSIAILCLADQDINKAVPFIVGGVLAALIIITLSAYVYARWRLTRNAAYNQL